MNILMKVYNVPSYTLYQMIQMSMRPVRLLMSVDDEKMSLIKSQGATELMIHKLFHFYVNMNMCYFRQSGCEGYYNSNMSPPPPPPSPRDVIAE